MHRVILQVKDVEGDCAAGYKIGNRIVIEAP